MPQNRKGDISLHFSNNNLHIRCDSFEPSQAHSILALVGSYRDVCPHIFVDVQGVKEMDAAVAAHFKSSQMKTQLRPRQLIFMGKRGFELAVDGNLVLIPKKPDHAKSTTAAANAHTAAAAGTQNPKLLLNCPKATLRRPR